MIAPNARIETVDVQDKLRSGSGAHPQAATAYPRVDPDEPWNSRRQADLDEAQQAERDWHEVSRLDAELEWLFLAFRRDREPPPWRIVQAMCERTEVVEDFFRFSWEGPYDWTQIDLTAGDPVGHGASYWYHLQCVEEAISWLDSRLTSASRPLMEAFLDQLIALWEACALAARDIPKGQLDS